MELQFVGFLKARFGFPIITPKFNYYNFQERKKTTTIIIPKFNNYNFKEKNKNFSFFNKRSQDFTLEL
jgi:hypothetical protein